ncbi:MAG: methyltransferase domain-containing protein [Gemmatimonadaceae bacterium]|nr:methyltransferase domain-containing protein [Gemmatimonadaceae bacterium]
MHLTPARRRGHEILDDPSHDPALAERSLRDVALANRLFGGRQAMLREIRVVLSQTSTVASICLLDIGTGLGDIPAAAQRLTGRGTAPMTTIGLELAPTLARVARSVCTHAVAGDGLALPFADDSIDIVTCSQVLHHFEDETAMQLLRECTRVARHAVIIGDLRRSWLAVAGLWLSSFALGFHPVSRHDGVVSILRGYTRPELAALVTRATGRRAVVRHALGWRVTATWFPGMVSQ